MHSEAWDKSMFTVSENTITGLSQKGKQRVAAGDKDLVIPAIANEIGDNAFAKLGLRSVKLCKGITIIGNNAFRGNKLIRAIFPPGIIKVGSHAYADNNLTSVLFPPTPNGVLIKFGVGAFKGNTKRDYMELLPTDYDTPIRDEIKV